jgi:hypothetical protein
MNTTSPGTAQEQDEFGHIACRIWEARDLLMQNKNVDGVGIGCRYRKGSFHDELCFTVCVTEKLPAESLSPEELIPSRLFGIPTDVIVTPSGKPMEYLGNPRPLKGGIQVTPTNDAQVKEGPGTLGCFANLKEDGALVMLSNHHVMVGSKGKKGTPILQPSGDNVVGEVWDYKRYEVGDSERALVDAAVARVHTGRLAHDVFIPNIIRGLGWKNSQSSTPDYSNEDATITGVAFNTLYTSPDGRQYRTPVKPQEIVRKVGRTTSRTIGKVVMIGLPSKTKDKDGTERLYADQILIHSYDKTREFAQGGDSGSVIVNDQNKVVGLLFSSKEYKLFESPDPNEPETTHANNIYHVLDAMKIRIEVPPVPEIVLSSDNGTAPFSITADSSTSKPMSGPIAGRIWDSGDVQDNGTPIGGTGNSFQHTYMLPGTYYLKLTLVDHRGVNASIVKKIIVTA